ncbi:MAG TPA: hypothetical protein VK469_00360 [Candidatus Kapabacteria bacterium]|nr:hypothetical protein [Candidatus Kapabacteria bacterium]
MEDNKDDLRFYPGYWIYNAGLVGMIRTLKFGLKAETDYCIENNSLSMSKSLKEKLIEYYPEMMANVFNRGDSNWFNSFFSQKGARIFQNNLNPNDISGHTIKYLLKENSNLRTDEKIFLLLLALESTSDAFEDIKLLGDRDSKKDKKIETLKTEIKIAFEILKKEPAEIRYIFKKKKKTGESSEKNDEESEKSKTSRFNYKSFFELKKKAPDLFETFISIIKTIDIYAIDSIDFAIQDLNKIKSTAGKEFILRGIREKMDCMEGPFNCAFCGEKTGDNHTFDMRWFFYEGGSTKFNNFYYNNSTQLPLCPDCRLVFYFSPLGIFPGSDTSQGEFINIPDVRYLWELNHYRMETYKIRETEKSASNAERSKLIDSIVSTGSYLKLKSRWLLQNIEMIEIGGKRADTVYNFEISPRVLNLLGDYSAQMFPLWLNQIEAINIKKAGIIIKGSEIIERVLKNDTGWLNKTSILLFKLYFETEKKSQNRLIDENIKPLLLVTLSLIREKQTYSEFLKLGNSIRRLFKSVEEQNKFEKTILPPLFNCVYTLRKPDFVEIVMKIYVDYEREVDGRLIDILKFNNIQFQVESLLLLTGILEKINHGETDE